jgi:DeoR/GlpR family transcriptional regulator of sugar metabolism
MMNNILPNGRRSMIASRLAAGGAVTASSLAAEFDVSEAAIGRDLRALAADGICKRVYGGALPISPASAPINVRIGEQREAKQALARMALSLVQPGESLFLDNGSTNLALAVALPNDCQLTVVTNSIPIAAALLHRPGIELIMIGGEVNPAIGGCVDAGAVLAAQHLNIDRCLLGACSISAAYGISGFDLPDVIFKRTILSASRAVVVMVTADKLETRATHLIAPLGAIDCVVVEHGTPASLCATLAKAGPTIVSADLPPS